MDEVWITKIKYYGHGMPPFEALYAENADPICWEEVDWKLQV